MLPSSTARTTNNPSWRSGCNCTSTPTRKPPCRASSPQRRSHSTADNAASIRIRAHTRPICASGIQHGSDTRISLYGGHARSRHSRRGRHGWGSHHRHRYRFMSWGLQARRNGRLVDDRWRELKVDSSIRGGSCSLRRGLGWGRREKGAQQGVDGSKQVVNRRLMVI